MTALQVIGDIVGTDGRFGNAERGKYSDLPHLSVSKCATLKDALGEYLDAPPRKMGPPEKSLQLPVQYP